MSKQPIAGQFCPANSPGYARWRACLLWSRIHSGQDVHPHAMHARQRACPGLAALNSSAMDAGKPRASTQLISLKLGLATAALILLMTAACWFGWRSWRRTRPPAPLVAVATLAGAGAQLSAKTLTDPFGVAV